MVDEKLKSSMKKIYTNNLTKSLYEYFGGKISEIPYLKTKEDIYLDRYGEWNQKLSRYACQPAVSINSCKELAEKLIDNNEYVGLTKILSLKSIIDVRKKVDKIISVYALETDCIELWKLYNNIGDEKYSREKSSNFNNDSENRSNHLKNTLEKVIGE